MKLKKFLLFLLVIAIFIPCCAPRSNEKIALQCCGAFSMPGLLTFEFRGVFIPDIIETDSYGRIMFKTSGFNSITSKNEDILIICQKYDDSYTYFYEDINYIFGDYSEKDVISLKQLNDWELPPNESKMSKRDCVVRYSRSELVVSVDLLDAGKIKNNILMYVDNESISNFFIIDINPAGQGMYCLETNINGNIEKYFVLVNVSYELSFLKIENNEIDKDAYSSFKKENGWAYGW